MALTFPNTPSNQDTYTAENDVEYIYNVDHWQVNSPAVVSVAVSDLADGTDGELITWDTAGVADTIPVGTAAHVLTSNGVGTKPTFQVAASGGLDTVLSRQTITGSPSTVDFDNLLTSSYDVYIVHLENVQVGTDGVVMWMRIGTGGTPTYQSGASDYSWALDGTDTFGTPLFGTADSEIAFVGTGGSESLGNATDEALNGTLDLFNASTNSADFHVAGFGSYTNEAGDAASFTLAGIYHTTTDVTSIQFGLSSGTFDTGIITLIGRSLT